MRSHEQLRTVGHSLFPNNTSLTLVFGIFVQITTNQALPLFTFIRLSTHSGMVTKLYVRFRFRRSFFRIFKADYY